MAHPAERAPGPARAGATLYSCRISATSLPDPTARPRDHDAARVRLRAATADLHARVDALFPRGLDCVAGYRRYLLGMHRFAVDYECALGAPPRHSAWLASDLTALSLSPLPAQGRCLPVAAHAAQLGWHYVMAGSSLGARVLLRDAQRLGFGRRRGADFLEGHALGDDWARLQPQLRQLHAGDASAMAEAGARAAFALVHACFERSARLIAVAPRPEEHE